MNTSMRVSTVRVSIVRATGWLCNAVAVSCLLVGCNSGIVVGVEDAGFGGAGASDYSQRPQPESWCWFLNTVQNQVGDTTLYEVDMKTGHWGARRYLAPHPPGPAGTIALHGRELIWDTPWSMASFNLDTGVLRDPQFGTAGITSNGQELLAFCPEDSALLCRYRDVASLWNLSQLSGTMPAPPTSVFALAENVLYAAPLEGNTVGAYDKTNGELLSTIELEGLEVSWVAGIAVVGDRLLRIDQPYIGILGIRISIHDVLTGESTGKVYLGQSELGLFHPKGLVCGGTFD